MTKPRALALWGQQSVHTLQAWLARLKALLPRSLFGRALLILVLPTVLVQMLAITIFYDRHWSSIRRHLSASLAGEVAVVADRAFLAPAAQRRVILTPYGELMHMDIRLKELPLGMSSDGGEGSERFALYARELRRRTDLPFTIAQHPKREKLITRLAMPDAVLEITVPLKRLESSTTYIFITWIVCSALLLTLIAIAFLRNQIRPITRLAEAAERFGLGQDVGDYRPHGAAEVRKAGRAFMVMRTRLMRQMATRTAMLTGVSHDLRTPLTRMKLQLAMMEESEDITAMQQDVQDMEHMLSEYLEFARGNDDSAPSEPVEMRGWLEEILRGYQSVGSPVTGGCEVEQQMLTLRRHQMKRAISNLIGNALHYGARCHVTMTVQGGWLHIAVEDEGPGIPEARMEDMFRPFTRMEDSRNTQTGGVGLGLAIARDIVQVHGGHLRLRNRVGDDGAVQGLCATISLPLALQM